MSQRVVMSTASTTATAHVPAAQVEAYKARGWKVAATPKPEPKVAPKAAKGESDK